MCGILSVVSEKPLNRREINDSLNSLQRIKHRGPDGEGVLLINTNTGEAKSLRTKDTPVNIKCSYQELSDVPENQFNLLLGHRRLSIIDLSIQGHQPMQVGEISLIYNGEIYNYLELKEELKAKGRTFKTNSDSEVLIQAYLEWGTGCLNKFNGMWSFVLWDNSKQKLFIANDRFGVKPLYYTQVEDKTILVSEIKQYLDFSEFDREFNKEYFDDYIELGGTYFGLVTPFQNVSRFPKGHFSELLFKEKINSTSLKEYYSINNIKKLKWKEKDAINTFKEIFSDAVKVRTRTDVPYGVGLSGGLDSSSVLLEVKKMLNDNGSKEKPYSFSAIFPGQKEDESSHVNEVLNSIKSNSFFTNPFEEFNIDDFEKHIYDLEFLPRTTSFFAQWKVAQLARREKVPVVLVGQGADEVFGGYHAHFYRYGRELLLKGNFLLYKKLLTNYSEVKAIPFKSLNNRCIGEAKLSIKLKMGLMKFQHPFTKWWNEIDKLSDFMKAEFSEFQLPFYLLADDRTSMACSVETRHPFLDYRLVEFGYSLPENLYIKEGWQKWIIREAMEELPSSIRWRKDKKGFSIPQNEIEYKIILSKNTHHTKGDFQFRPEMVGILKDALT